MKASMFSSGVTRAPDIPIEDLNRQNNNSQSLPTSNPGSSLAKSGNTGYEAQQTSVGSGQSFNKSGQSDVFFGAPHEATSTKTPGLSRADTYQKSVALMAINEMLSRIRAVLMGTSDGTTPLVDATRQDMTPPPEVMYPGVQNPDGSVIKTERDVSEKPTEATGRPEGDTRTAEQIIEDNPILKNLGDQKDIKRNEAYARIGDWSENNKDPESRADAAYNAAKVLNWINSSDQADGAARQCVDDSDLQGITHDGDARHGTEAGNWKDFVEQGYTALKDDHRLDKTNDSHVRADGSNKDNVQAFLGEVGKNIWPVVGLSNVLVAVGESKGGLAGALKAGAGAALETTVAAAEGATDAIKRGRISPVSVAVQATAGALSESRAAPDVVKTIAGLV
ncbi:MULTISPECIES: hypothetical protein [Pseudomonas syringae group]|uniref:Uncharacterized protein n=2 Tax=Pseudomonas syringae group TaxID=136849 RepID=A0ABX6HCL5_9PSED|nr:hypothetical protein [Pseudomonas asturiensis]QHF03064.1 hypothetical protein N015_11810 [Pseudomonas asturiensis]